MADTPINNVSTGQVPDITNTTSGTPEPYRLSRVPWLQDVFRLQQIGCTITIGTPVIGTGRPLFGIEVRPDIYTSVSSTVGSFNVDQLVEAELQHPVWIFSDPSIIGTGPNVSLKPLRGISVLQYDQEPPLSRMIRLFRNWRGSIYYVVRAIAKFTDQGDWSVSRIDGVDLNKMKIPDLNTGEETIQVPPIFGHESPITSVHDAHILGYTRLDISEKKHLDIAISYFRAHSYDDRVLTQMPEYNLYNTKQMILFTPTGTSFAGEEKEIQFNLEYMPGPDFEFLTPMYPFIMTYRKQTPAIEHYRSPAFASYSFGDPNILPVTWRRYREENDKNIVVVYPYPFPDPQFDWYTTPTPPEDKKESHKEVTISVPSMVKKLTTSFERLNVE